MKFISSKRPTRLQKEGTVNQKKAPNAVRDKSARMFSKKCEGFIMDGLLLIKRLLTFVLHEKFSFERKFCYEFFYCRKSHNSSGLYSLSFHLSARMFFSVFSS